MTFNAGATRQGPEILARISRRNFWPGSKRRARGATQITTLADALFNKAPLRQRRKRPRPPLHRRGKWATLLDRAGDSLEPRPNPHYPPYTRMHDGSDGPAVAPKLYIVPNSAVPRIAE